jgi:D-arabinose 1-dehydrogenase-like Zn-dependent alcohol dehydrogenase
MIVKCCFCDRGRTTTFDARGAGVRTIMVIARLVPLGLLAAALGDAAVTCDLIVRYSAVLEHDGSWPLLAVLAVGVGAAVGVAVTALVAA